MGLDVKPAPAVADGALEMHIFDLPLNNQGYGRLNLAVMGSDIKSSRIDFRNLQIYTAVMIFQSDVQFFFGDLRGITYSYLAVMSFGFNMAVNSLGQDGLIMGFQDYITLHLIGFDITVVRIQLGIPPGPLNLYAAVVRVQLDVLPYLLGQYFTVMGMPFEPAGNIRYAQTAVMRLQIQRRVARHLNIIIDRKMIIFFR